MPRMQVCLRDDLYGRVRTRHLPSPGLLRQAVRAEVRSQELPGKTDGCLSALIAESGTPSPPERARAEASAGGSDSQHTPQAS